MTTDWRTPDKPLDEVRYRLTTFKNPSFDRTVVEALVAEIDRYATIEALVDRRDREIESLDAARKANVETCVAYAKRIEELRKQVVHLTEALERRGEQIFGREGD